MHRFRNSSLSSRLARLGTIALVATALVAALPAASAVADAPGPTDYLSRVVSVDPPSPHIHPSIIGGDSFLSLRVDRGTDVQVLGYRSEPFIRFLADGTVQENRTSASHFVSRSRLGGDLPPDFVDGATPNWHTVATDGEYAWHDHRIHWMTDSRPPGRQPGDVVLREEVPLLVAGEAVTITVESIWMPAASRLPAWLGAGGGLAAGLLAAFGRHRHRRSLGVLAVGVLATIVGAWQFRSLPAQTGPQPSWFAFPAVAALATAGVVVIQRRSLRAAGRNPEGAALAVNALLLLAGVNLVLWAWWRRAGITSAVVPTDAPGWLDRFATGAAMACGLAAAGAGLATLVRAIVSPRAATPAAT